MPLTPLLVCVDDIDADIPGSILGDSDKNSFTSTVHSNNFSVLIRRQLISVRIVDRD